MKNVIEIDVSEATARERVLGRARGADDNADVFNNRMHVYLKPIQEIRNFYTKAGILKRINGERSIEEIVREIEEFIQSRS